MESATTAVVDGSLIDRVTAGQLPPPGMRRSIRKKARATLRDFAAELNVGPMTVLRWERGETEPRLGHAIAYRRLLDGLRDVTS